MALGDYLPWRKSDAAAGGNPLARLQGEMNNLFESFFRNPAGMMARGFAPDVDVVETREAVRVTAEVPGIEPADIDVTITEDSVSIQGEKRSESAMEEEGFKRIERSFGRFERTVSLPVEVQVDQAEATYKNGVLTIRLPKSEASRRHVRKVDVRAG